MKILIHGRKNGYSVLYPKPTPTEFYSFASDIQSLNANNYNVYYGKNFYTIAFVTNGYVFTKYVIGDDVQRGQLGEIGISVFIPNTQKLSGADIKTLLDELINKYNRNYIFNNKIDEPKNDFDWSIFSSLANGYDAKLQSRSTQNDNVTSGTKDPAFQYYKSDSDLIEHFDKPFQEEYSDYKQILFIDSNLQGASNPLNIIKNSGIEVNPDLKNEHYYLDNFRQSKGVTITANGMSRSDEKGQNQIRLKWQVEINYSKDYHKPIFATGSISDPVSEIHKYLEIYGNDIRIKYDAFKPDPETKSFTFDVETKNDGTKVIDAEIQVDSQPWQKITEVTFTGEELGEEHKIVARKGDSLISEVVRITPKDSSEASILLPLIEKKVVKVTATDQENGNAIYEFKVHITGKDFYMVTDEIEFVGDEIDKEWNIQIEKPKEYSSSENRMFCPAKDGYEINFKLRKAEKQPIESSYHQHIYPGSGDIEGKHKIWKWVIIGVFAIVLVLSLLALLVFGKDKKSNRKPLQMEITEYVNSDLLMPDTLRLYKEMWEEYLRRHRRFSRKTSFDTSTMKNYRKPVNESIGKAIKIRDLIEEKNFEELRNQQYSDMQKDFKNAIDSIESSEFTEVGNILGNVYNRTLSQIADSINSILELNTSSKTDQSQEGITGNSSKSSATSQIKTGSKAGTPQQSAVTKMEYEIIQYIKGSELHKSKLEEYLKTEDINQNLKKSLKLCLDFWALDGKEDVPDKRTYWTFRKKIADDKYLKDSNLKTFLDKIVQDEREEGKKTQYTDSAKIKGLRGK